MGKSGNEAGIQHCKVSCDRMAHPDSKWQMGSEGGKFSLPPCNDL